MYTPFVEQDCTLSFEGKQFTSGGAWMLVRKDTGKAVGVLYAFEREGKVGTWHGDQKWEAYFGHEWRSNMGDARQHVKVTIEGRRFAGIYYKSAGDIVRLRQVS